MLVLTRNIGQDIVIGEGDNAIRIKLLSTKRDKANIGITAPKHISIHREEIYNKIHSK